jgi:superfamily II DNA or RNA helicase
MGMILRDYQQAAIDATLASYASGKRRPAFVMATGGGKTPTFAKMIKMAAESVIARPSLVLAHRTELIDQAADKLRMVAPDLRVGKFQGSVKQWRAQVVVGSIQTASTPAGLKLLGAAGFGFVVVDECHHSAAPTYVKTLRELGAYDDQGPLVLGVTATLGRADGLALGEVFDDVPYRIGLIDLVRRGYLVPPRGIRVKIAGLDMSRMRTVAGDLRGGEVAQAMHDALAPAAIVRAYLEHAKGRPTIAFLPSVALSIEQAEAFREQGVTAVHIDGTTPPAERRALLDAYRAGEIDVLCNCGLFTEGTDLPTTACIILGRPTKSAELYQQMVGRGLRLAPGKTDCVVLDVTGVTGRHKLATIASLAGGGMADDEETVPDDLLMYEDEEAPRTETAPADDAPPGADGPLEHELVDLFGRQNASWLRTDGGTWFLPTPAAFVYLTPAPDGLYDLRWVMRTGHRNGNGQRDGLLHEDPLELGYAMAFGDEYAASVPQWGLERDAGWRTQPATQSALRAAGMPTRPNPWPTRGELADLVAVRHASRLLDSKTN